MYRGIITRYFTDLKDYPVDEIRQSHDALLESQKDLIEATEELGRYHRTFFGFYVRDI